MPEHLFCGNGAFRRVAARGLLIAALLALAASQSQGQTPLDAAGFEAYATGKTLYYGAPDAPYGAEQYLPGRRVIWSFAGDECQRGYWYDSAGQICFVYENEPGTQCWRFEQTSSGLRAFFMQYLLQMGLFFVVPLYLSVALGLSAIATGVRIMPLPKAPRSP